MNWDVLHFGFSAFDIVFVTFATSFPSGASIVVLADAVVIPIIALGHQHLAQRDLKRPVGVIPIWIATRRTVVVIVTEIVEVGIRVSDARCFSNRRRGWIAKNQSNVAQVFRIGPCGAHIIEVVCQSQVPYQLDPNSK